MKKTTLLLGAFLLASPIFTQNDKTVTLAELYLQAEANYALGRQSDLFREQYAIRSEQLEAGRLPQLLWTTTGSIQSEAIELPLELPPTLALPELPIVRFQTQVEANYTLLDGGVRQAQAALLEVEYQLKEQGVEVAMRELRPRINQLFFGILIAREQSRLIRTTLDALQPRIDQVAAAVEQGIRLPGDLARLELKRTELESQRSQLAGAARALLATLTSITGVALDTASTLQLPDLSTFGFSRNIRRPELDRFDLQRRQILASEQLVNTSKKPRVALFFQGGLGYPNPLNFFDDNLSPFALGGVRATYPLTDWKHSDRDREWLTLQDRIIETQRQTFLQSLEWQEDDFRIRAADLQDRMSALGELLELQNTILRESQAQLAQGVITSADYLEEVQKKLSFEVQLATLQIGLDQLRIDYLTHKGLL